MNLNNQDEEKKPLLTREQLRHELNVRGYVISASYFSKICLPKYNKGPPAAKLWGKRPLYHLKDGLAWAEERCKTPAASTAA
jgi:hypothetical protein